MGYGQNRAHGDLPCFLKAPMTYFIHKLHQTEHKIACGEDPDAVPSKEVWCDVTCPKCREKIGKMGMCKQARTIGKVKRRNLFRLEGPLAKNDLTIVDKSLARKFGTDKRRKLKFGDTWNLVPHRRFGAKPWREAVPKQTVALKTEVR